MGRFLDFEGVDAVLFDCDGVLVDSEPVSEWAWRSTLVEYGIEIGDFSSWVGTTDDSIAVRYAPEAGVAPPVLADRAAALLLERLSQRPIEVFPDARKALDQVEGSRLSSAVVTNSESWRLEAILNSARLEDRFTVRITADDVAHPKPEPDIYLLASRLVETDPSRCLVLEDSPTGVASARAAGMRVVAVDRGVFGADSLAAATRVVQSLL